uniref:Protein NDUFAF4 homolog n=1 Tax=Clastoptera arizonana TaxID=38151 RepID=A0A1B6E004_9HEMI
MGKVLSSLSRHVKIYNVEERAFKVISKEKPVPAPLHQKSLQEIEQLKRENPSALSEQQEKNEQLDQHLKNVYVLSHDPKKKSPEFSKSREIAGLLPQLRKPFIDHEYGYFEPDKKSIAPGKFTLKQAIKFLSKHQEQPDVYTAEVIAKEHKIDQNLAENVIRYFSMFGYHDPRNKTNQKLEPNIAQKLQQLNVTNVKALMGDYEKEVKEKEKQLQDGDKKSDNVT